MNENKQVIFIWCLIVILAGFGLVMSCCAPRIVDNAHKYHMTKITNPCFDESGFRPTDMCCDRYLASEAPDSY